MKKKLACILFFIMTFSLVLFAGCGNNLDNRPIPYINEIKIGEDNTDLKEEITFLTFRTDIMDKLNSLAKQFNVIYPNIKVKYVGVNDYETSVLTMLSSTKKWGDIMMIPHIEKNIINEYFIPLGKTEILSNDYNFMNTWSSNGLTYGIPSTGNAYGLIYNKKVFSDAGVTNLPKTPNEFINALNLIKLNTKAIPLYTNYADEWPMSCWDAYIGVCASGDANYINQNIIHQKNPFSNYTDGQGTYAVYKILYDAVSLGLTEEDYTTTSEMASYGMLNNGGIGCMAFGSWACIQAMDAGENRNDIGYMPFPITVNEKQYTSIGPDYSYGINKHSSYSKRLASEIYIKWLTEYSQYATSEGGLPIYKKESLPELYKSLSSVEMLEDAPAKSGEEDLFDKLNFETGLCFNANGNSKVQEIVECAFNKNKSFDEIMNKWNVEWGKAQKKYNIEIYDE